MLIAQVPNTAFFLHFCVLEKRGCCKTSASMLPTNLQYLTWDSIRLIIGKKAYPPLPATEGLIWVKEGLKYQRILTFRVNGEWGFFVSGCGTRHGGFIVEILLYLRGRSHCRITMCFRFKRRGSRSTMKIFIVSERIVGAPAAGIGLLKLTDRTI